MKRTPFVLPRLEQLEDRCTPTVWGIPWTNGSHLTVSFVPDGTSVDGTASVLWQKMASCGLSTSVWEGQILQSLQTWAKATNINFSVVPDKGAPLGASGAVQGDSRFGDIRIACVPMSLDVLALTTPPGSLAGTRAGDIVFNSNDVFTVGSGLLGLNNVTGLAVTQDLYTVALHEVGHALGLPDNTNSASVMYSKYQGAETTLAAVDVTAVQALYGTPASDPFVAVGANSFGSAFPLQPPATATANSSLSVAGDLTTSADVNYFQLTTGATNPNGLTVQLQTSSQSLLAGQISIYDTYQNLLATTAATGAEQNLSLTLTTVRNNAKYFIKVARPASTPFSVGAYQLNVISNPTAPTVAAPGPTAPLNNQGKYATLATALPLQTTYGYATGMHYSVQAIESSSNNVDVYSFQSATVAAGQPNVMTIAVQVPAGGVLPDLTVYGSTQQQIPVQVLDNGYGHFGIQLANAQSNATYYVAVSTSSDTSAANPYRLDISFCSQTISFAVNAQGTLSQANVTALQLMSVSQSDFRYFALNVNGGGNSPATWVNVTIYDLLGQVVGSLTAGPGQTVSTVMTLNAGLYTIGVSAGTSDGSVLQPVTYTLDSVSISSPIGSTLSNPNTQASGSGTTSSSSTSGSSGTASSGSTTPQYPSS